MVTFPLIRFLMQSISIVLHVHCKESSDRLKICQANLKQFTICHLYCISRITKDYTASSLNDRSSALAPPLIYSAWNQRNAPKIEVIQNVSVIITLPYFMLCWETLINQILNIDMIYSTLINQICKVPCLEILQRSPVSFF
jgi:hypothetical protein